MDAVNELQRLAVEESRLGIPLMIGRDVIHGFKTVLPIPLGLAATFNPDLVRRGDTVYAEVEGSEYDPYQVEVSFGASGVGSAAMRCSIPTTSWMRG